MTVPPSRRLIALISASSASTTRNRRWPVIGVLMLDRGRRDLVADQHLRRRARLLGRVGELARVQRHVGARPRGAQGQGRRRPSPPAAVLVVVVIGQRQLEVGIPARLGLGFRFGVEQQVGDAHRAHAVDHAVMGLGGDGPAPAPQADDQHHLPQRRAAVQALGEESLGPRFELGLAARRLEHLAPHVAVDGEPGVGLPGRPLQAAGLGLRQPLAVPGQPAEALLEQGGEATQRRPAPVGRPVEHHDPADVHVGGRVALLELEEGGVQRGEPIGHVELLRPAGARSPRRGRPARPDGWNSPTRCRTTRGP